MKSWAKARCCFLGILLVAVGCAHRIDPEMAQRGMNAIDATNRYFRIDNRFYRDQWKAQGSQSDKPAPIWPASIQLSALNAAAAVDRHYVSRVTAYADALLANRVQRDAVLAFQPHPRPAKDTLYFDDNEWLVLDFVETYELSGDQRFFRRAKETFDFVMSGESPELGGGIWWRNKRDSKNTCSNAPAVCCALRLYEHTEDPGLLASARRIYRWTKARLQDDDALFFDNVNLNGSVGKPKWSYNSAMMIRANCLLYRVTESRLYLDEAERIADASEKHWFRERDGALMDEAQFGELLCEALLQLSELDANKGHVKFVRRALDYVWAHGRTPGGLFAHRWDEDVKQADFHLMDQASAARGFLFAARYPKVK